MAYCTNCGNKIGEGARFCTNCGKPGAATAAKKSGNNTGKTQTAPTRKEFRTYYDRRADYSRFNNVRLVSKLSHHQVHAAVTIIDLIIMFICLIVLFRMAQATDVESIKGIMPVMYVSITIMIICEVILRKIRHDIIHALPKGFDYWQLRRLLKWRIFGFNTLKTGALRLLQGTDGKYPELGFGTDDEGNYYAFAVDGEDVDKYPFYTEFQAPGQ
ncbi:MAG: zinc-ribbon domain-containing protein [Lachnospiraceae bacterium]|nr:zinc-ribbon domain-containing protein [Lachnospiraceae bacterium]